MRSISATSSADVLSLSPLSSIASTSEAGLGSVFWGFWQLPELTHNNCIFVCLYVWSTPFAVKIGFVSYLRACHWIWLKSTYPCLIRPTYNCYRFFLHLLYSSNLSSLLYYKHKNLCVVAAMFSLFEKCSSNAIFNGVNCKFSISISNFSNISMP